MYCTYPNKSRKTIFFYLHQSQNLYTLNCYVHTMLGPVLLLVLSLLLLLFDNAIGICVGIGASRNFIGNIAARQLHSMMRYFFIVFAATRSNRAWRLYHEVSPSKNTRVTTSVSMKPMGTKKVIA